jgi:hypothetical protein
LGLSGREYRVLDFFGFLLFSSSSHQVGFFLLQLEVGEKKGQGFGWLSVFSSILNYAKVAFFFL